MSCVDPVGHIVSGLQASLRTRPQGSARVIAQRLISLQEAASFLGLGSRWAVRRLVVSGQIPVVKLAGKWRLDLTDLERFITDHKTEAGCYAPGPGPWTTRARARPRQPDAHPPRKRRFSDSRVTAARQVPDPAAQNERATDT